ncbi:MAG: rifampicin phosphotransferase, partial [Gaiellales bacterium]|nr:rifampicin phosphotransferase [Gaiellales bacterium]
MPSRRLHNNIARRLRPNTSDWRRASPGFCTGATPYEGTWREHKPDHSCPRAGYVSSSDSLGLRDFRGRGDSADTLTQSVPHNVTSEMGLALLDVADVIRPHPEVVAFLQHVEDEGFLYELAKLAGGQEARDAIQAWLDKYGMRCVGEIDITRPRWSERPTTLVPVILGNIKNFEPGAGERRFEQGRQEAW